MGSPETTVMRGGHLLEADPPQVLVLRAFSADAAMDKIATKSPALWSKSPILETGGRGLISYSSLAL